MREKVTEREKVKKKSSGVTGGARKKIKKEEIEKAKKEMWSSQHNGVQ